MLFDFKFCITYLYIHNCVHIIFKIWYITIILSYFLLCAVHQMQGFVSEQMLQGNQNYSQDRRFLPGNEENPALVLSNVHNRTSARDGPMFGSMGLSLYTTSLEAINCACYCLLGLRCTATGYAYPIVIHRLHEAACFMRLKPE